jgi:acyl-CoA reductase-like NAD-dependent aldehyde dehydrogenase
MASTSEEATAGADAEHTIEITDPTTGGVVDTVAETEPDTVQSVVEAAARAQRAWADRSIAERRAVVKRARELILERRDDLAATISAENGKPPGEAIGAEIGPALDTASFLVSRGPDILEEDIDLSALAAVGDSTVVREPVGVVGLITPWNYPFGIPVAEALPALFAGNAVVLKPAEETTLTALELADLLHEAGVPEDLFQVVPGRGATTGQALSEADIDHLSFTGSAEVGFTLEEACEARGVSTCLELGGSDPAIVLADADLDLTADGITWSRFANAGQSCGAPKRLFAMESIADDLTDAIVDRAEALEIGGWDDADYEFGPLITAEAVERIHDQVERSVEMGAEVVIGGEPLDRDGHYYPPTVLREVTPDMPVMTEETFGPVLPIVPVEGSEDALELANDTNYGLTGSVWTTDTDRGEELARHIEAGTVTVNDHLYTFSLHATPWGGPKDSGGDFSHGRWGLESVTEATHVHVAAGEASLSSGRFKDLWWFPYGEDHGEMLGRAMEAMHSSSTIQKLRNTPGTLRAALSK